MKTIEVTDEMYNSLIELSKEMLSQDNRATAMPHMFQIRTDEEIPAHDGCGESIWIENNGEIELRSDEDEKDYIIQFEAELFNDEMIVQKTAKVEAMSEYEISSWLEKHDFRQIEVSISHKYANTFFTAKACDDHIKRNHYHYNNPVSYLNHALRNPEMELISKFLCQLTCGKIHK